MEFRSELPSLGQQKEYYTERWNEFRHANRFDLARIAQVLRFMEELALPGEPKICDFGCGAGWVTNILSMFGDASGLDLSDTSAAQQRFPHCHFQTADAVSWQEPTSEFDLVVSLEVIEHIEGRSGQSTYLKRAYRMLKPGGSLILTTPNKRTMEAIPGGGRTWSDQPVENWLSAAALTRLLEDGGFRLRRTTSLCLGVGYLGSYRLINSPKVNGAMKAIGFDGLWRRLACSAGYGLHLAVLAEKV